MYLSVECAMQVFREYTKERKRVSMYFSHLKSYLAHKNAARIN